MKRCFDKPAWGMLIDLIQAEVNSCMRNLIWKSILAWEVIGNLI